MGSFDGKGFTAVKSIFFGIPVPGLFPVCALGHSTGATDKVLAPSVRDCTAQCSVSDCAVRLTLSKPQCSLECGYQETALEFA